MPTILTPGDTVLATFVIGLREGLEAALIVGIIAAFLKRNNRSLVPLWCGVLLATVLSVGVGVVLRAIERSLPQAAQEGMETVIGAIAVVFVTGMVVWMGTHSRGMKKELEKSAGEALGEGTSTALALMAFLAVLKEGFETAVFLLATFQASSSGSASAMGAVLGILVAIGLGYGLYSGGVSLNLGKFFRYTSVFLVLVAAGLVVSAVRTAHEAGWLNAGQQEVLNLTWLAPPGSIRSALFTGVLGIPARPRLIEVVAWFAYLIPTSLIIFWPAKHRLSARTGVRLRIALAALCAIAAAVLPLVVAQPRLAVSSSAPLAGGGTISLDGNRLTTPSGSVTLSDAGSDSRAGMTVRHLTGSLPGASGLPVSLTLDDLLALSGSRLPVGITSNAARGPFRTTWAPRTVDVYAQNGGIVDAEASSALTATLAGGGLTTPRTLSLDPQAKLASGKALGASGWKAADSYTQAIARSRAGLGTSQANAQFLRRTLPSMLALGAIVLAISAARAQRRLRRKPTDPTNTPSTPDAQPATPFDPAGVTPSRKTLIESGSHVV